MDNVQIKEKSQEELIREEIENEETFVNLLGYKAIGPDNSNRFIIVDENNNNVGFIQRKKLHNKNVKRGLPAIFGYQMEIESPTIHYFGIRRLNSRNDRCDSPHCC